MRILIIEDQENLAQLIKKGLELGQFISLPQGDQCKLIKGKYMYTLEVLKTDKPNIVKINYSIDKIVDKVSK